MEPRQPPATDDEILHASRGLLVVKRREGTLLLSFRWFGMRKFVLGILLYLAPPLALPLINPVFLSVNLISVIFGCTGLWGLYWTATQLLNSTRITVDPAALRVRHGPVPWPGSKQVNVKELEQLYVGFESYRAPRSGNVSYTFKLRAKTKQGGDEVLVGGPLDLDRAKALEAVLEKHLGIVNVPVKSEWSS